MATLSVTIPDTVVARVQTAFGHYDNSVPPVWVNATIADVQAVLKNALKNGVLEYETAQAATTKRAAVNGETW